MLATEKLGAAAKSYILSNLYAPSEQEYYNAIRKAFGMSTKNWNWSGPAWALNALGLADDWLEKLSEYRIPLDSEPMVRLLGSGWFLPALIEQLARNDPTGYWFERDAGQ
ncbi:hypothetical protein D3C85_1700600 [compost metagenome]